MVFTQSAPRSLTCSRSLSFVDFYSNEVSTLVLRIPLATPEVHIQPLFKSFGGIRSARITCWRGVNSTSWGWMVSLSLSPAVQMLLPACRQHQFSSSSVLFIIKERTLGCCHICLCFVPFSSSHVSIDLIGIQIRHANKFFLCIWVMSSWRKLPRGSMWNPNAINQVDAPVGNFNIIFPSESHVPPF